MKKYLFLSMLPSGIMVALFYSLAWRVFDNLGEWPATMGTEGFSSSLIFHVECARGYFQWLYLMTVYASPGLLVFLLAVKKYRRKAMYLVVHCVSFWMGYGSLLLAPAPFLAWWWG